MPRFAQRMTRAVFAGLSLGIFGGTGLYLMAKAVNTMVGMMVVSETGMLMLGMGGALVSAIAIELSEDMGEASGSTPPVQGGSLSSRPSA